MLKQPTIIKVTKQMKDNKIAKKEGHFFSEKHYTKIINEDCDVFIIDDENKPKEKRLLLSFRKNIIPREVCCQAFDALEKEAQKKHNNRGSAGGLLNTKKLPKYVKKTTKKSRFRSYYIGSDGKEKKDHISNYVSSGIIGYFDRYDRNVFKKSSRKKTKVKPNIPCRTTKFTKEQVSKWKQSLPLIKYGDELFKNLVPDKHMIQLKRANKTPKFQIENTAFSTVTINYNYQTGCHKDRGDLEEGFGNLIVLEKDQCFPGANTYSGGFLGFPQYKVAVDIRQGDFLAMDVHEWHTNTKIKPKQKGKKNYGRLSLVCYLRKNMIKCSKK